MQPSEEQRIAWLKSLPGVPASAAVIVENQAGELLTVKSGYKRYWSLPGGVIDRGESPKRAALREVNEEIGLALDPGLLEFLGVVYRTSPAIDTYQFLFKAPISPEMVARIVLQESEIDTFAFVAKQAVLDGSQVYAPVIKQWATDSISGYDEHSIEMATE